MPTKGTKKCACCEIFYAEDDMLAANDDGKPICERCLSDDECEPCATVLFSDDEEPHTIGEFHNYTDGEFQVEYVRTDGWRGYYNVTSDSYMHVRDDAILWGSKDAKELRGFDELLRMYCNEQGIRYARVFSRTSNVFCQGYDFFVHKDDVEEFEKLAALLASVTKLVNEHRDSDRFSMTALTGKDEFDESDQKLLKASKLIAKGMTLDEVMEEVLND